MFSCKYMHSNYTSFLPVACQPSCQYDLQLVIQNTPGWCFAGSRRYRPPAWDSCLRARYHAHHCGSLSPTCGPLARTLSWGHPCWGPSSAVHLHMPAHSCQLISQRMHCRQRFKPLKSAGALSVSRPVRKKHSKTEPEGLAKWASCRSEHLAGIGPIGTCDRSWMLEKGG